MVFLNPGTDSCIAHCRARPWEAHKYSSPEEQHEQLAALIEWVSADETRGGEMSLAGHRALFNGYDGPKVELRCVPDLDRPDLELSRWLARPR